MTNQSYWVQFFLLELVVNEVLYGTPFTKSSVPLATDISNCFYPPWIFVCLKFSKSFLMEKHRGTNTISQKNHKIRIQEDICSQRDQCWHIIIQKKYAKLVRPLMLTDKYLGTVSRACEATHVDRPVSRNCMPSLRGHSCWHFNILWNLLQKILSVISFNEGAAYGGPWYTSYIYMTYDTMLNMLHLYKPSEFVSE